MPSLQELKAKSKANLEKFKEKSKAPVFEKKSDDRFWAPKKDEAGNGFAIIRFLPVSKIDDDKTEALPWVKIYSHSFKNEDNGKWYIENSLTTFNEKDPLGEYNAILWDKGEDGKAQASRQKRTLSYYTNVYIVKDPANPENEGKVFLFRFGKKINDKILELMNPDETYGEEPVDPFNFWTGRNFRLKIKNVKTEGRNFPNYDSSEWDAAAPISDKNGKPLTDEQIEKVWESEYSLLELIDRTKHFKTYEQLKKRMNEVLFDETNTPSKEDEPVKEKAKEKPVEKAKEKPKDDIADLLNSDSSDDTDALIDQWINED